MKVYAVVERDMNPYGEAMGSGPVEGLFFSRASATAKIKSLREKHKREYTNKSGILTVCMPSWTVRQMTVRD